MQCEQCLQPHHCVFEGTHHRVKTSVQAQPHYHSSHQLAVSNVDIRIRLLGAIRLARWNNCRSAKCTAL